MSARARAALVASARRHSRVPNETEDLAHDLIVSALRRGIDFAGEAFQRSADGAARRHAARLARTALRRQAREASTALLPPSPEDPPDATATALGLSSALETTLLLLMQGLEKAELCAALGVTDAALRKRFQMLRACAPLERPQLAIARPTRELRQSQAQLLPRLKGARAIAAADPDGHGIILVSDLTPRRPTATSGTCSTKT